jgi:DNA-binding transcriptional regulator LsrR (DeoR family)
VWSLVEVGIKPEDIPGYTEETKAIASVAELYARGFKRSDIAEKMGITVDEVGRLKARSEGVAIVWYR